MLISQEDVSLAQTRTVKAILIVEDDEGMRAFLKEAIEQETCYRVLVISTSQRAVEVVQHITPDLFLFDYHLDRMTGIDLYKRLHAVDGLTKVPTIIFSASLAKHIQEIEDHHLVGLSKPIGLDELLTTIARILEGEVQNENTSSHSA